MKKHWDQMSTRNDGVSIGVCITGLASLTQNVTMKLDAVPFNIGLIKNHQFS